MKRKHFPVTVALLTLAVLTLSAFVVRAAGGRIEGKITDPKGEAVSGATVTATEPETNRSYTATTDAQGRYKFEGLTAGTYTVVVSSRGFSEGRREMVRVEEGAVVSVDLRLEIAPVEADVTVANAGLKSNSDPVYQQLRQQAKSEQEFAGAYASVNNLSLKRDAATFVLRSGEIYFVTPVEGRITGAVWASASVAALFAWHPLHVESVAWVIERKDVLSTFFFLLAIWFYAGYARGKNLKQYLLVVLMFALGLMS